MDDNSTAPTPVDSPTSGVYIPHQPENAQHKVPITSRLCIAIFGATLGMFSFGYHVGVINAPQKVMEDFFNQTYAQRSGDVSGLSVGALDLLWGFTVAIYAIGGIIGAVMSSWWADKVGRRRSLMLSSIPAILAAILMSTAKVASSYHLIIIGRAIVGYSCGLYTTIAPLYNSEISPRSARGAIGTINAVGICTGVLVAQILGLPNLLGTDQQWPILFGVSAVAPLVQLVTLVYVPESPRHLLAKGKAISAEAALMILRDCDNFEGVKQEMAELVHEQNIQTGQTSVCQLLVSRQYRLPLALIVVMHLSQQLSGFTGIIYYSTDIFISVGIPSAIAGYATLSIGGLLVGMSFFTIFLMDVMGRRSLILIGILGMSISSLIFTLTFTLSSYLDGMEYPCLLSTLVFIVFFSIGPGTVPWLIPAELFPQAPRAAACSIGVVTNWTAMFISAQFFPLMLSKLDTYVLLPFTVLMVFYYCYLYISMPETKNKSIEDISAGFLSSENTGFVQYTSKKTDDYNTISKE